MKISIRDDLDLAKIASCGQTFRAALVETGVWRFVTGTHVLYLSADYADAQRICEPGAAGPADDPAGGNVLTGTWKASCDEETWEAVWAPYFDLGRNYAAMRESIRRDNAYTEEVCENGRGIRILRQDPWETLVTFIISQRRSIPAIRTCVEKLCASLGPAIRTERETLYLFPAPETVMEAPPETLAACGVGYRLPYIRDAAERVVSGALDLEGLEALSDEELLDALRQVKGVGLKVAGCVALFGYGRMACAPVDVWIARAIEEYFGGRDPFLSQGELAGLLQQYMFYYAQQRKKS